MPEAVMNDDGVIMCDVCPEERATAKYRWAWGEEGYCCSKGQFLLNQRAKNLKQTIDYLPLVQAAPEPLKRDERVRLIAEKLAAESERDETAERNSRLYAQNTELGSQLRSLKLRNEAADAQIRENVEVIADLKDQLSRVSVDNGKLSDALARANALLEAGPGEEAKELASLRDQVSRLQSVEEKLRNRNDELQDLSSGFRAQLIAYKEQALAEETDETKAALIEADLAALRS